LGSIIALGNVYEQGFENFLRSRRRLDLINATDSKEYPNIGAMTRMTLMSDFIERLKSGETEIPNISGVEHIHLL
jgi:hypothetical protein